MALITSLQKDGNENLEIVHEQAILFPVGEGFKTLFVDPSSQGRHHGVRSTVDTTRP